MLAKLQIKLNNKERNNKMLAEKQALVAKRFQKKIFFLKFLFCPIFSNKKTKKQKNKNIEKKK